MNIFDASGQLLPMLKKVWQHFMNWQDSSFELQVSQELDRHGHTRCWRFYDPLTGRSGCFGSQEEMQLWIEKCYYRN